ncbi:MAG TPA: phosphatase PAP2 family protein [Pyrinomonadaceae bacterium]|jgi:undecaprenyl-diphosphatase|nr:phosphatase PAP2 family protein [Pyrinomonadaceae bacterium]
MNADEADRSKFLSLSLILGLAAAIGALIFFGWLADEVLEGETRHFDEVTRAAIHQLASPALTGIMRGVSFIGSTISLTVATGVIIVCFAMRKRGREAKLLAITMIGAALLNMTLKLTFKRARPVPFFNLTAPETYSFPSGHSLMSCCFFGALAAILTGRIKRKRLRVVVWTLATAMFLLIGFSRIYLGVHHTTDVIAGFVAAMIWILIIRFVEMELRRRKRRRLAADEQR